MSMLDNRRPWIKFKEKWAWLFELNLKEGLLLIAGVSFALIATNSPWHEAYHNFWQEAPVSFGITAGLAIGKTAGILSFVNIKNCLDLVVLPEKLRWNQLLGAASFAGIGFTMSLFIAQLAFKNASLIARAKMGISFASTISALIGIVIFLRTTNSQSQSEEANDEINH